ncbi:hypothetical protein GE061_018965 [Apolygus lucorum]|uniref:Uncharacterized protein n=1 Tax=Apolygus lucorum TaxID=248454 RepID=A0A8S9X768_APOLU|nr:hypothetical protein GE061_018965 [Apolygus lucorum]
MMPGEDNEEFPNVRYDWSYFRQDSRATLGELLEMQDRLEGRRPSNRFQVGCTVRVLKKAPPQVNASSSRMNGSSSSNSNNGERSGPILSIDTNHAT